MGAAAKRSAIVVSSSDRPKWRASNTTTSVKITNIPIIVIKRGRTDVCIVRNHKLAPTHIRTMGSAAIPITRVVTWSTWISPTYKVHCRPLWTDSKRGLHGRSHRRTRLMLPCCSPWLRKTIMTRLVIETRIAVANVANDRPALPKTLLVMIGQ